MLTAAIKRSVFVGDHVHSMARGVLHDASGPVAPPGSEQELPSLGHLCEGLAVKEPDPPSLDFYDTLGAHLVQYPGERFRYRAQETRELALGNVEFHFSRCFILVAE